jgi:hypothetical protein
MRFVIRPNRSGHSRVTAWEAAEKAGHDMSLIESNLRKTPCERIRAHSRELATAVMLRQAMEKRKERAAIVQLRAIEERSRFSR